jgi:MFS family permease
MMLALGTVRFGFYSSCMNALGRPILIGVLGYDEVNDPKSFNTVYGMVNLLFSIGAAIGTLLGGKLADKYGRNRVFYLSMIIDLLNVAPMMIAHTAPLLISRVLLGISTGLASCIYNILLAEVLPSKLRGIGSSIAILFLTSSILISAACQNIWSFDTLVHNWRYLLIYPLLLEIFRVILFPFLFKTDTPRYIY